MSGVFNAVEPLRVTTLSKVTISHVRMHVMCEKLSNAAKLLSTCISSSQWRIGWETQITLHKTYCRQVVHEPQLHWLQITVQLNN